MAHGSEKWGAGDGQRSTYRVNGWKDISSRFQGQNCIHGNTRSISTISLGSERSPFRFPALLKTHCTLRVPKWTTAFTFCLFGRCYSLFLSSCEPLSSQSTWIHSLGPLATQSCPRLQCVFLLSTLHTLICLHIQSQHPFIRQVRTAWFTCTKIGTMKLENKSNRVRQSDAIFGVMALLMIALLFILLVVVMLRICLNSIISM